MRTERYSFFASEIKKFNSNLIKSTQEALDTSTSKEQDYHILANFWDKSMDVMINHYNQTGHDELTYELYLDKTALSPMLESVCKQMVNLLFKIKHLNVLTDLMCDEGLEVF